MTDKHVRDLVNGLELGLPWFLEDPDPTQYVNPSTPFIVFDFETTNLDKGSAINPQNDVVSAAWYVHGLLSYPDTKIAYHRGGQLEQNWLLEAIEEVIKNRGFLVCHNAKFELQWLKRMGVDLHRVLVYDTMIGDYVLAGNRRWKLALGDMAPRYGMPEGKAPLVDLMMKGGVCPSTMPPEYLQARAIRDVKQTLQIFLRQRKALEAAGQLQLQYTRCLFTPCLAEMEMNGIALDSDRVYEEYLRAEVEYEEAMVEFNTAFGEVNPRSPKDMAVLIYGDLGFSELRNYSGKAIRNKKTKTFPKGAPKVDEKTLNKLNAQTERQKLFLTLRKKVGSLNAELTKTLEFFKGIVDEKDGVFYGQFNQCIAKTHRLTSSSRSIQFEQFKKPKGIQLQNMPRKFKDLVRAKVPGNVVGDVDGSQLEFRAAAYVSQDTQAIYNIRHDVDQHAFTARALQDLSMSDWDSLTKAQQKALRQAAKADTFKPLYGGSRGTPEQERYYAAFREEFPELAETQEGWTYTVLDCKKLRMPWGMTFHFPYTRQNERTGYIDNTTSIYNYPIQNLATAEIIPIAVTYLWHRADVNDKMITLFNTVHDSVTGEFPPESSALWKQLGVQCFTTDTYSYLERVYGMDFNVPLGVGISIGTRWESPDATEWEANVERDGTYWVKGERA